MGMRITKSNDTGKPRVVEFFNPTSGKKLGSVMLPVNKSAPQNAARGQGGNTKDARQ